MLKIHDLLLIFILIDNNNNNTNNTNEEEAYIIYSHELSCRSTGKTFYPDDLLAGNTASVTGCLSTRERESVLNFTELRKKYFFKTVSLCFSMFEHLPEQHCIL